MRIRNSIEAMLSNGSPDIVEDLGNVIYQGYFIPKTNETQSNNCMIIKIETTGKISTRKFANGINYDNVLTWENRADYSYSFASKDI